MLFYMIKGFCSSDSIKNLKDWGLSQITQVNPGTRVLTREMQEMFRSEAESVRTQAGLREDKSYPAGSEDRGRGCEPKNGGSC